MQHSEKQSKTYNLRTYTFNYELCYLITAKNSDTFHVAIAYYSSDNIWLIVMSS